jgi:hypothetical protein
MPNHCMNWLTVKGPKADIDDFVAKIQVNEPKGESFSILGNLYPIPQELRDTVSGFLGNGDEQKALEEKQKANIAKYGHKDWYDWAHANWGTKWGDYEVSLTDQSELGNGIKSVSFTYTTAWSPAVNGIVKVSGMFPTLRFVCSYEESGMGFVGAFGASKGDLTHDIDGEYPEVDINWDADDASDKWNDQQDALLNVRESLESVIWDDIEAVV